MTINNVRTQQVGDSLAAFQSVEDPLTRKIHKVLRTTKYLEPTESKFTKKSPALVKKGL